MHCIIYYIYLIIYIETIPYLGNFPKILKHLTEKASKSDQTEIHWMKIKQQISNQERKQYFIGLGVTSMLASILIYFLSIHSWAVYPLLLISIVCFIKGKPN